MRRASTVATLLCCLALTTACASPDTVAVRSAKQPAVVPVVASRGPAVAALSADKIWRKTKARLDTVSGFHVSAELPPTVKGTKYVRFNFSMGDEGRAFGSMQTGASSVLIHRYGQVLYFRGDRGFWHEDGSEPKPEARAGRWFKVTKNGRNDYQEFFDLTDKDAVLARVLPYVQDEVGRLSVVAGNREYSTTPNIGLTGRAKKDTDTVFVSTTGPLAPELLQVSLDDHHYYRFDTWNDPVKMGAQAPGAVSLDR